VVFPKVAALMPPLGYKKAGTAAAGTAEALQPITAFFTLIPKPAPLPAPGRPKKKRVSKPVGSGRGGGGVPPATAPAAEDQRDEAEEDQEDQDQDQDQEDDDDEKDDEDDDDKMPPAAQAGQAKQRKQRINWSSGEPKERLEKAYGDWEKKTGVHLISNPQLSLRKFAELVNIPRATLYHYVNPDATKRLKLGSHVGNPPIISCTGRALLSPLGSRHRVCRIPRRLRSGRRCRRA
jgi:hypothetical protein